MLYCKRCSRSLIAWIFCPKFESLSIQDFPKPMLTLKPQSLSCFSFPARSSIHKLHLSSTIFCRQQPLEQLNPLPTFPSVTALKTIPLADRARLYANHLLVPICGPEITHRRDLSRPRIPYNDIAQLVTLDLIFRLLILGHCDGLL